MTRHLAIGDIHGCITALKALIDTIGPTSDDIIVTLGDYVDRGPDSRAVLDTVIELHAAGSLIPLRGNHEIMLLDAREKTSWFGPWLQYGGDATLRSYAKLAGENGSFDDMPEPHLDFLQNSLLPYYECDTHFFVHATVDAELPLNKQSNAALYWRKYKETAPHCSGKIMVCGHSQQRTGLPLNNGHSICIDTFAHGGGWLSCLDVENDTIWQANEAGDTRTFTLQELAEFPPLRTDPRS